jgi:hypothetical protein
MIDTSRGTGFCEDRSGLSKYIRSLPYVRPGSRKLVNHKSGELKGEVISFVDLKGFLQSTSVAGTPRHLNQRRVTIETSVDLRGVHPGNQRAGIFDWPSGPATLEGLQESLQRLEARLEEHGAVARVAQLSVAEVAGRVEVSVCLPRKPIVQPCLCAGGRDAEHTPMPRHIHTHTHTHRATHEQAYMLLVGDKHYSYMRERDTGGGG